MCAFANSDSNDARALSVQVSVEGGAYNNTVANCIDACVAGNYHGAGLEDAQQCCTPLTSS